MRPWLGIAAIAAAVVAVLAARGPGSEGNGVATERSPAVPEPPGLAAARPSPASSPPAAAPSPPASAQDPTQRARARVRFVAVDAAANEAIDPRNRFVVRFPRDVEPSFDREASGVTEVSFDMPDGSSSVDAVVYLAGWGYLPYRGRFSIQPRRDGEPQEVRVPLEPISADAWTRVVVALEGDGPLSEDEAVAVWVTAPALPDGFPGSPPAVRRAFTPGGSRTHELAAPGVPSAFSSADFAFEDDRGRRVWVDPRDSVRAIRREEADGRHVATVVRRPYATLVIDVTPAGMRRDFQIWGITDRRDEREPSGRRWLRSTYSAHVRGGADVLRISRAAGRLGGLHLGRGARGTCSPDGFSFDPASTTPLTATLTLEPGDATIR